MIPQGVDENLLVVDAGTFTLASRDYTGEDGPEFEPDITYEMTVRGVGIQWQGSHGAKAVVQQTGSEEDPFSVVVATKVAVSEYWCLPLSSPPPHATTSPFLLLILALSLTLFPSAFTRLRWICS